MEIFKIVGVGLLTCFVAILVKQIKPEFYILVLISGGIILCLMVLDKFAGVINYFSVILKKTKIDSSIFLLVLKIVGVSFLTEFAANICVDSGNSSIADKIIFAGKTIILFMCLPVISSLLDMIIEILP